MTPSSLIPSPQTLPYHTRVLQSRFEVVFAPQNPFTLEAKLWT